MHGKGIYAWPSGEKYSGMFKGNTIEGEGVFLWPDGRRYEGEWR